MQHNNPKKALNKSRLSRFIGCFFNRRNLERISSLLLPTVQRLAFSSIRTRIVTATAILIIATVGAVVWLWATSESELYLQQKRLEAKSFLLALCEAWSGELYLQNWGRLRLNLSVLMKQNKDFAYIFISDFRLQNQIVAASPVEFEEQFFPDLVKVSVTESALQSWREPRDLETFLLRDVEFPAGQVRAKRGDRVIEVASGIRIGNDEKIGTCRIGISLRQVDRAVAKAVKQALQLGAVCLILGLIGAYILAMQLSKPVQRLQQSAAKIASGDLQHRAEIHLSDEIGALANSFNEMTAALQVSFNKLQKTLEAFERFVPDKFLAAIAPDGIENIEVGVASTRTMTILFSDIVGYTAMSENMTPMETFNFLNDYLARMGTAIDEAGGFIDKYIGDAIMALFDDEATDGAINAAIAMQQKLAEFNLERASQGLPPIRCGIGIHRGEVVMGTVGFTSRIDSTVIGDAVNVAARVEGLTRHYECGILVTASVVLALRNKSAFTLRLVSENVKVKGKDEAIAIYELPVF